MHWWQVITAELQADFFDLPTLAAAVQLIVRLLTAALLGGLLGYEREHARKAAGVRTHMLVALGAAVFVTVPQKVGMDLDSSSRVLQGLISGIGFLGGGAIVKMGRRGEIHGLTTAAGIWLTAGIGVAAGMGRMFTAIFSAVLAFLILAFVPHLSNGQLAPPAEPRPVSDFGELKAPPDDAPPDE